ncbi:MAG TPA: hypothetical protein VK741_25820 [Acetobacteraceae bacterium]|nr:hypothetical protein [Acetobacteraceae bacterium]
MPDGYTPPPLIYAPAVRGASHALIMLTGTYGTGKTYSALRLATGLAEGGEIGVADTENGRALFYAGKFKFKHLPLREPFRPQLFEAAAVVAQKAGVRVWICDNFSWEHVGPGGVLDWQGEEILRLSRGDASKFEAVKAASWIAPKGAHMHMLQRLWQLNMHVILVCQAKKKLLITKDPKTGKTKWSDGGWAPICGEDIPYAMTTALLLQPTMAPGVPVILKPQEDLDPLIPEGQPLSEATGAAIAAWARGENPAPPKPVEPSSLVLRGEAKNIAVAMELVQQFAAVRERKEHFALVDNADVRKRIDWFKANRPQLYSQVTDALADSWGRTEPPATAGTSAPPEDDPGPPPEDGWLPPEDAGPAGPASDFPGDPGYRPPVKQGELV